jgi:hypothetical protein
MGKNYSFRLEPGETTRRTKHTEDHYVIYRQGATLKRMVWEPGASEPKTYEEKPAPGERIFRPAGTDHTVTNMGDSPVDVDKDFEPSP